MEKLQKELDRKWNGPHDIPPSPRPREKDREIEKL
jgi:hypothetical protein